VYDREPARHQALINGGRSATQYCSDDAAGYTHLVFYPSQHQALPNKSQTSSVEAGNAELRHYLARLARRSRCFARSLHALRDAVNLFIFARNGRQLFRREQLTYPAHLRDFVYPLLLPLPERTCLVDQVCHGGTIAGLIGTTSFA
jgi:hypothetical protein